MVSLKIRNVVELSVDYLLIVQIRVNTADTEPSSLLMHVADALDV